MEDNICSVETYHSRGIWNWYNAVCFLRWGHFCMTLQGLMVFQYVFFMHKCWYKETSSSRGIWNRYSPVCSIRWCHLCMTLQGLMVFQYFLCINASCYAILPSLPPSPLSWYEDIFQKIMTSTKNVASGDFSTFVEELYSVSHCDILTRKCLNIRISILLMLVHSVLRRNLMKVWKTWTGLSLGGRAWSRGPKSALCKILGNKEHYQ